MEFKICEGRTHLCDGCTCAKTTFISTKINQFLALKSCDIYSLILLYDDYNFLLTSPKFRKDIFLHFTRRKDLDIARRYCINHIKKSKIQPSFGEVFSGFNKFSV